MADRTLRILKNYFGYRKLGDIKPYDVEVFLKSMRNEGRSDSYITGCRGMLYQIFHKAEANDLVRKNPVRYADKMRSRGPVKRKEAFTANEIRILMRELPNDRIGLSIRLLLGTGMRAQELLALEPRHISEDGSIIYIRQAMVAAKLKCIMFLNMIGSGSMLKKLVESAKQSENLLNSCTVNSITTFGESASGR